MQYVHGTCGRCGGAVTTPKIWMGVLPAIPQCQRCHAYVAPAYGPTLPMAEPARGQKRR